MTQRKPKKPSRKPGPRDRVFEAALTAIAEHGGRGVRMAHIAELAGMSPGHILYYFQKKDRILAETLSWTEAAYARRRRDLLAHSEEAPAQLLRYIEIYLPDGPRDPRWVLWLVVYDRAPGDDEISSLTERFEREWHADLAEIVARGIRRGEFARVDPDEFTERFLVLLGGYGLRVLAERPGATRETTIRRLATLAAGELGFRLSAVLPD